MVYRGKPSAACAECRKRRNRCDQSVPSCGQCTRTGRICSGYRNLTDLIFHDETEQVLSRNRKPPSSSCATIPKPKQKISTARAVTQAMALMPIQLPETVLYQPPEDLGVKFFMSNYVGEAPALSMLNYLPEFYAKAGYASPGLHQSIVATGLAGFVKASGHAAVLDRATGCYVSAIRGINGALTDLKSVSRDSTLMAIIMSAVFEIITSSATKNCSKHLAGAVSVASLTMKQKQTVFTQRILTTLVQCVIMNCQIQNEPPPSGFAELKAKVGGTVHPPTVHELFLDIVAELADFELGLNQGRLACAEAVAKASAIDESLRDLTKNMPLHWRFEEFCAGDAEAAHLAYRGYFHVYPQRFTALLWNNIRSMRIRLHQVILRQCQAMRQMPDSPRTSIEKQEQHSKTTITTMAQDLSATIPQLTGYLNQLHLYFHDDPPTQQARFQQALESGSLQTADNDSVAMVQIIPHHLYDEETKVHATSTVTSSSSSSSSFSSSSTTTTSSSSSPSPSPSPPSCTTTTTHPRSATLYHTLFQLHALRSLCGLPASLSIWLSLRISSLEAATPARDLAHLRGRLRKAKGDGLPDGPEPYVMQTYDFSRKLQVRADAGAEADGEGEQWSRNLMW